jgi:hypothetical protein
LILLIIASCFNTYNRGFNLNILPIGTEETTVNF